MSGHSKWSTIKRQKAVTDQARGKLFSKLSKAISVAVKTGGGGNVDTNSKLRIAIEAARSANMPKNNIERAMRLAQGKLGNLEEVTYEGFGPGGIAVIAEVATDNRNRTGQEIKGLFERVGGGLAGPGAVSYNFEPRGLIIIEKTKDSESLMLELIDLGVEEIEETDEEFEVYVDPNDLFELRSEIQSRGAIIKSAEYVQKPKSTQIISQTGAEKAISFLDNLNDHDDVQKVYANVEIGND